MLCRVQKHVRTMADASVAVQRSCVELWLPGGEDKRVEVLVCHVGQPSALDVHAPSQPSEALAPLTAAPPASQATNDAVTTAANAGAGVGAGAGASSITDRAAGGNTADDVATSAEAAAPVPGESDAPRDLLEAKRSIYGTRLIPKPGAVDDSTSSDSGEDEVIEAWEVDMALWAHVWITSVIMSEVLLSKPMVAAVKGKRVFEIGAGSGMPAAVAALAGAAVSTASDLYPAGLEVARHTAEANDVPPGVMQYRALDWNNAVPEDLRGQVDVVIGSDVM